MDLKPAACGGLVGYGDADPSNVCRLVHGAEMRVVETRAVNPALRRGYGIRICSIGEIGSFKGQTSEVSEFKKFSQNAGGSGIGNGNLGGPHRLHCVSCPVSSQSTDFPDSLLIAASTAAPGSFSPCSSADR